MERAGGAGVAAAAVLVVSVVVAVAVTAGPCAHVVEDKAVTIRQNEIFLSICEMFWLINKYGNGGCGG